MILTLATALSLGASAGSGELNLCDLAGDLGGEAVGVAITIEVVSILDHCEVEVEMKGRFKRKQTR